jgi:hypothetical protein
MNFFRRLFGKPDAPDANAVECPRCLGKGHVDMNDIKRLGQELRWKPGRCAFCNGFGRVDPDVLGKVAVNEGYLTTNLSNADRKQLFNGDERALEKMWEHNSKMDSFILEVRRAHVDEGLSAEQITESLIKSNPVVLFKMRRAEILAYIRRVLQQEN